MDAYDLITSGLQLRKLLAKRVEPIMEEYGLRPVELDILEFITKENIDTAKEIIHRIHLSKSHISKSSTFPSTNVRVSSSIFTSKSMVLPIGIT